MSTVPMTDSTALQHQAQDAARTGRSDAAFAICLPSMSADLLPAMMDRLHEAFPGEALLVASPHHVEEVGEGNAHFVPYPLPRSESEWVLTGADYAAAARLVQERSLAGVLLLGIEAATLSPASLRALRQVVETGGDLGVPRYRTGPQEGLVNSALLYPLTRALFGANVHFPLPLDAALSPRMLARLGGIASRPAAHNDSGLVWPVSEAVTAGFTVREADGIERVLPRPQEADLNVLFPAVTSSLFADMESRATFWQRPRSLPPLERAAPIEATDEAADPDEIRSLVDAFRLAYSNLREIWALVLPPQSLLALKKLSLSPAETFTFPSSLWARTVYDFGLAFHLRTLNRAHLLGSMTPLYLAWVASLLQSNGNGTGAGGFLDATARAFEQEKPYLVSRWRWPDRFNP